MGSYFRDYFCPTASQRPTVGDTKFSTIGRDHMGWLKCDGSLKSTEEFNILFQAIGYKFGGSGTQFKLPDMRGHVPGAIGQGYDEFVNLTSNRLLGQNIGEETHTLIINEMPAHKHGATAVSGNNNGSGDTSSYTHDHGGTTGLGGYAATSTSVQVPISGTNVADDNGAGHNHSITADTHTHTIANTGGGAAHNNMQPTLFIGNMFIYSGKAMAGTYTYF